MNVLNALVPDYDVDLLSLTSPNQSELESYYDLSLPISSAYTSGAIGPTLERGTSILSDVVDVGNLGVLDVALTNQLARRKSAEYDLMISTMSEMYFETPSIQYVHFPNFYRSETDGNSSTIYQTYESVCQSLSKAKTHPLENTKYLTNSKWTANRFQRTYGITPDVLYPPVDTRGFSPVPWENREEGILVVGRMGADKRIVEIIDVFESLKSNGYDGSLHIVGPKHDEFYYQRIQNRSIDVPDVEIKGSVSRSELVSLMSSYRYAIHGKDKEHFGMVIAEYVAAGMIPFLPDSGGQPEIVNNESTLLYESWECLEKNIESVLESPELQHEIRRGLPDVEAQFGTERFAKKFKEIVESKLNESQM